MIRPSLRRGRGRQPRGYVTTAPASGRREPDNAESCARQDRRELGLPVIGGGPSRGTHQPAPPAAAGARQHAAAAVPGLVEQLTPRELEILALLAAGTPNPRIAEQLVVSLDTVKKHVSHLLGKLGAANRTEAVTRARELGLIP